MKKSVAGVVAGLSMLAAAVGLVHGGGSAEAISPVTYDKHGITLTTSQTVIVAHNNLGTVFSGVPYVPNLVYNPSWGRVIQAHANSSARRGGCIEIGIATPRSGGASNLNYVTSRPASRCAR